MRVQSTLLALLVVAAADAGSPAKAVAAARADASGMSAVEASFHRYLWISTAPKQRDDFLLALKFQLNLLSTESALATPTLIAPDVARIDLRDYGLHKRMDTWELFARIDPYFHSPVKLLKETTIREYWPGGTGRDGKPYEKGIYPTTYRAGQTAYIAAPWLGEEVTQLRGYCYSEVPILHAEWFVTQTARQISIRNKDEKVGYYEWLGLKKRDDFFRLTGSDEKKAIELQKEWRAIVDRSGVSQQNRQIVALVAITGRVWGTLDTFDGSGRGVAKRNLLRGEFVHNAEEWFGFLPNGLPVTFLADNQGNAQASAPDQIGVDDSALRVGRDARIHVNLACLRCHGNHDFLQPIDDWARRTFKAGGRLALQDPNKSRLLELQRQYLSDLDRPLRRDREDYADAVTRLTISKRDPKGLNPSKLTRIYAEAWNRYVEQPVSADDAARELGIAKKVLLDAIERHGRIRGGGDLVLASLLDEQTLTRLEWESSLQLAFALVHNIQPPEIVEEKGK